MKIPMTCAVLLATTLTAHAAPKPHPPKLFAKLFVEGASWTFTAQHVIDEPDSDGSKLHKTTTKDNVTCTSGDLGEVPGGWIIAITCDGYASPVSGTYVATSAGLWRVDIDWDRSTKSLRAKEMLIGSTPKAGKRELGDEQSGYTTYIVSKHAGGWCFANMQALGDESGWMLCISEKKGLIGGNAFMAGAFVDDFYFGQTPRY
ncbi:MAG TPA: hypothetical protein VGM90_31505 [Kofleriaceae bacterium]|jgi:hypothetical protein